MSDDKVRVRARGTALCPDFDAADREPPLRRKIGRSFEEVTPGRYGWVPTGKDEAVGKRAEVARAIADGDLYPADEATASWAHSVTRIAVAFDPSFGGPSAPLFASSGADAASEKASKAGKAGS